MSRTVQEIMLTGILHRRDQVKARGVIAGDLVGIISRADVLSVFDRTDSQIHNEITEEVLLGGVRTDLLAFNVTVKDGIVTLSGRPEASETGHEIVRQIRHLQGVVAVQDRLSYPGDYPVVAGPVF